MHAELFNDVINHKELFNVVSLARAYCHYINFLLVKFWVAIELVKSTIRFPYRMGFSECLLSCYSFCWKYEFSFVDFGVQFNLIRTIDYFSLVFFWFRDESNCFIICQSMP